MINFTIIGLQITIVVNPMYRYRNIIIKQQIITYLKQNSDNVSPMYIKSPMDLANPNRRSYGYNALNTVLLIIKEDFGEADGMQASRVYANGTHIMRNIQSDGQPKREQVT